MLRLMAPKNLPPLKENILDLREGALSVVGAYIIPALKVHAATIQVSQKKEKTQLPCRKFMNAKTKKVVC